MKHVIRLALALVATAVGGSLGQAEDGIDAAKSRDFDTKLFAHTIDQKAYACFVRRYDAAHLAQHPRQKVGAMKLLVTAEIPADDPGTINRSFYLGVKYRSRAGNFDSAGSCRHSVAGDINGEIRLGCGVECDGGSITVAMKDDKSAIVELERVRMWDRKKPDAETGHDLEGGAEDRSFRVDRADLGECAELVTDRQDLAALKKARLAALKQK